MDDGGGENRCLCGKKGMGGGRQECKRRKADKWREAGTRTTRETGLWEKEKKRKGGNDDVRKVEVRGSGNLGTKAEEG